MPMASVGAAGGVIVGFFTELSSSVPAMVSCPVGAFGTSTVEGKAGERWFGFSMHESSEGSLLSSIARAFEISMADRLHDLARNSMVSVGVSGARSDDECQHMGPSSSMFSSCCDWHLRRCWR